ncbi:NUMOD4 domain-containing protein [Flavobacterium sp.]|uniref:NUMOD4 domain-containing protein n=1 Tax=Flavobacterium sp. TaxID=239 RepID=UPI003D26C8D5
MSHFITEQWKEYELEVPGKVRYAVSNLGRLKSFTSNIKEGKIIKHVLNDGFPYFRYVRQTNNVKKNYQQSIHKIIGELFLPKESEEQTHVIHLDYDKNNNVITNLKWVTYQEMREHGYKSPHVAAGRKRAFEKFGPKNTKLREIDVIRLKRKLLDPNRKTRLRLIAKEFGISEMQLHRIKTGENWGHIKI